MTPPDLRPMKKPQIGSFELLEARIALDADGLIWGDAPYLTLSFAPDGTNVDGRPSALTQFMRQIEPNDDLWRGAIISAFNSWAAQTNSDVAEVADDGSAFGIDGETQLDPRFGDIRVGAIPMRDNVFAIAVSRGFVAGTWAGDLFFNTNAQLGNIDEVFRVALHEAGHIFGFEHNNDPTSVMFKTGLPSASQPSVADLDELWSRFGTRLPDVNERDKSNYNEDESTHMSSSDSFDGTSAIIIHADIGAPGPENEGSSTDIDVYRFDPPDDAPGQTYEGPVTLQVRTAGLSQLDPMIEVIRERDNFPVASEYQQDESGQITVMFDVTLDPLDPTDNGRHHVFVRAADGAASPIGSYALVATIDESVLTTPQTIDRYSGPEFRFLDLDELAEILEGNPQGVIPFFGNDLHLNDTLATATPLDPLPGFAEGAKYSVLASISDNTDVDYYEINSVDLGPNTPIVSILVDNIEESLLDSRVELLDENGAVLTHTNLLHHNGRTLIQLTGIEPDRNHYVRVAAVDALGPQGTGNYRLTVVAGAGETEPELFVSAVAAPNFSTYSYNARRPQLVTFAFDGSSNSTDAAVAVTLVDRLGNTIFSLDGRTNDFFTADSVLLSRGHYRLRVDHEAPNGQIVNFQILAAVVTDPLAVPRDSSFDIVFEVPDFNDVFVFPRGEGSGPRNIAQPAAKPYAVTTVAGTMARQRDASEDIRHDDSGEPAWFEAESILDDRAL